jgi:tripartite ATP-independent transporter DctP family solute receptor
MLGAAATALALSLAAGSAQAQTKALKLSHHLPPGHLVDVASKRFAELVAEGTRGAVKIEVFPAAQIAGLRQGTEAVQVGTVDLVWSDFGTLGNWRKELGFISLPFLFKDFDHVLAVFNGPVGADLREEVRKSLGIEILGYGIAGFRVLATRDRPVNGPGDLKGLKLRVPEVPVYVATFKALDANPTPMPFGEVYTALQTGVIDGVEVPAETMWSFKIQEVAKNVARTYHILTDVHLMMNATSLGGLTPDQQTAVKKAAETALAEYNMASIAAEGEFWTKLAGVMKGNPNPDREAFRQALLPVWNEFDKTAGGKAKPWIDRIAQAAGK